jgi:hypothetical protein
MGLCHLPPVHPQVVPILLEASPAMSSVMIKVEPPDAIAAAAVPAPVVSLDLVGCPVMWHCYKGQAF